MKPGKDAENTCGPSALGSDRSARGDLSRNKQFVCWALSENEPRP